MARIPRGDPGYVAFWGSGFHAEQHIFLRTRRRSYRARDRRPGVLPLGEGPTQSCAGLILKLSVIVVFDLCPQDQSEPFFDESDLILKEGTQAFVIPCIGNKGGKCDTADLVGSSPVTQAPDEGMPVA